MINARTTKKKMKINRRIMRKLLSKSSLRLIDRPSFPKLPFIKSSPEHHSCTLPSGDNSPGHQTISHKPTFQTKTHPRLFRCSVTDTSDFCRCSWCVGLYLPFSNRLVLLFACSYLPNYFVKSCLYELHSLVDRLHFCFWSAWRFAMVTLFN